MVAAMKEWRSGGGTEADNGEVKAKISNSEMEVQTARIIEPHRAAFDPKKLEEALAYVPPRPSASYLQRMVSSTAVESISIA